MKIEILNAEHGIGSCNVEDIPEWATKYGSAKDVAFFYCRERDWIVLNKDNVNYEFYKMVVEEYPLLCDADKRHMSDIALKTSIKVP